MIRSPKRRGQVRALDRRGLAVEGSIHPADTDAARLSCKRASAARTSPRLNESVGAQQSEQASNHDGICIQDPAQPLG